MDYKIRSWLHLTKVTTFCRVERGLLKGKKRVSDKNDVQNSGQTCEFLLFFFFFFFFFKILPSLSECLCGFWRGDKGVSEEGFSSNYQGFHRFLTMFL
jgi:hypothetical protein